MYEILDGIRSPQDIKRLETDALRTLCAELRDYIVRCCAENPGHLASSLGAVELIVGMHYVFDAPADKFVFDVGHQAYAHKILTGRKEAFRKNRRADGISGFPRREESPFDAFGTGHSRPPSVLPGRRPCWAAARRRSFSWATAPSPEAWPSKP